MSCYGKCTHCGFGPAVYSSGLSAPACYPCWEADRDGVAPFGTREASPYWAAATDPHTGLPDAVLMVPPVVVEPTPVQELQTAAQLAAWNEVLDGFADEQQRRKLDEMVRKQLTH